MTYLNLLLRTLKLKRNKSEYNDLICSAIERGLNDKIVQVRIKSWDLFKELISDQTEKPIELKDLSNIIGLLIDYLSENNPKVKEKSEDMLNSFMMSDKFDFNESLTLILSRGSKINKAITRYNHSKLTFLVNAIEKEAESPIRIIKNIKKTNFPISLFLDFVDKWIIKREKVLNKMIREKVEKAIWLSYTKSNFDSIKDYINDIDEITYSNLTQKIPELKPKTPEVQTK